MTADDGFSNAEALVQHTAFLRRIARPLVADAAAADDAVQEALMAGWRRRDQAIKNPQTWLAVVTRNAASKIRRADSRRTARERRSATPEVRPGPDEIAERHALARAVVDAVFALREPEREVIHLRYFEDVPPREISARLGIPVETVRTRLKRALDRVRERLDAEESSRRGAWAVTLASMTGFSAPVKGAVALRMVIAVASLLLGGFLVPKLIDQGDRGERVTRPQVERIDPGSAIVQQPGEPVHRNEMPDSPATSLSGPGVGGRVLDLRGRPLPGARVTLSAAKYVRILADDRCEAEPGHETISDETGPDGRFWFATEDEQDSALLIRAPGHAAAVVAVRYREDIGDVLLRPSIDLFGVVRDLERRPVPNAIVRWSMVRGPFLLERQTPSLPDGSFRIREITAPNPGVPFREGGSEVLVEADGFAPVALDVRTMAEPTAEGIRVDLWLSPGAYLTGLIRDAETGQGIPNARVELPMVRLALRQSLARLKNAESGDLSSAALVESESARPSASTDADGRYRLHPVPSWNVHEVGYHNVSPGVRNLHGAMFRAEGYAPSKSSPIQVPDPGEEVSLDGDLLPSAVLHGRCVDLRGDPVVGASVRVGPVLESYGALAEAAKSSGGRQVLSDADGEFVVHALAALRSRPTQATATISIPQRDMVLMKGLTVRAGESTDLGDVMIRDAVPWAEITVVDEDGSPVIGADVNVVSDHKELRYGRPPSTGRGGKVSLTAYAASRDITVPVAVSLSVKASGYVERVREPVPWTADRIHRETIVIKHAPIRRAGRAVTRNEERSATVRVRVTDLATGTPALRLTRMELASADKELSGSRVEPGVYLFPTVPLGTWTIHASARDRISPIEAVIVVVNEPDRTYEAEVSLDGGVTVIGRLVASDGTDLTGHVVDFDPLQEGAYRSSTCAAGGRFQLRGVRPGDRFGVTVRPGAFTAIHVAADPILVPNVSAPDLGLVPVEPGGYLFITANAPRLCLGFGGSTDEAKELGHRSVLRVSNLSGREVFRSRIRPSSGISVMLPYGTYQVRMEVPGMLSHDELVQVDRPGRKDVVIRFEE